MAIVKSKLESVFVSRSTAIDSAQRDQRNFEYLDQFELKPDSLQGIGRSRVSTLQAFGITTAAHVSTKQISRVPGFGPKLTGTLLTWRSGLLSKLNATKGFQNKPLTSAAVASIDARFSNQIENALHLLRLGRRELNSITGSGNAQTTDLFNKLQASARAVAQTEADYRLVAG